jgi:16S rRNA (guanine527-N7)-methyltransferase
MDARGVIAGLLHELEVPDAALSLLLAHADAVAADADRLGLVAERSLREVLLRHTADSLLFALARRPSPDEEWLDVGSGAGFPGLVLACTFPATRFVLLEPQARRAGFLDLQILNLGLSGVGVRRARLEAAGRPPADVVVSRALEKPERTTRLLVEAVRPGGQVLLAAGPSIRPAPGARVLDVSRPHVDSPGRVLMMTRPDE